MNISNNLKQIIRKKSHQSHIYLIAKMKEFLSTYAVQKLLQGMHRQQKPRSA